jgi:hypothetical protein
MIYSSPIKPQLILDNGLFVIDIEAIKLPKDFKAKEKTIVYIPPREIGGNHIHLRTEVLIGIGDGLEIHWLDKDGKTHKKYMNSNGKLNTFIVESKTPHAVINKSDSFGILIEYANCDLSDAKQIDVALKNT